MQRCGHVRSRGKTRAVRQQILTRTEFCPELTFFKRKLVCVTTKIDAPANRKSSSISHENQHTNGSPRTFKSNKSVAKVPPGGLELKYSSMTSLFFFLKKKNVKVSHFLLALFLQKDIISCFVQVNRCADVSWNRPDRVHHRPLPCC